MPVKKITALKKLTKVAKLPEKTLDDKDPRDALDLVKAMGAFLCAIGRDVLDYDRKVFNTEISGPLNLNKMHDELMALKTERDTWRTRCESIETAFNALPK